MSNFFDKLNLRPQERRLVVIVGIVVFIVLNLWLVIPMFGDYGKYEQRIKDSSKKLNEYKTEIQKKSEYEKQLRELESQGGFVPTEEAGLRLSQEVNSQAALSGVTITSITPLQRQASAGKTNAFFEEAAVTVNINTGEKELLDFLFRLADKELLIRSKSMTLGPDPTKMRLQGQITLVKSFQRRPPPKVAAAAAGAAKSAPASAPKADAAAKTAPKAPATVVVPVPPPQKDPDPVPAPPASTNRNRRAAPAPIKP